MTAADLRVRLRALGFDGAVTGIEHLDESVFSMPQELSRRLGRF